MVNGAFETRAESFKAAGGDQGSPLNLDILSVYKTVSAAERDFKNSRDSQGIIGQSVDWVKNHLGASARSENTVSRLWSHVVNSDNGSVNVQNLCDQFKAELQVTPGKQATSGSSESFLAHISPKRAADIALEVKTQVNAYKSSQNESVDAMASLAVLGAAVMTRGKLSPAGYMVEGAAVKSAVKLVDGTYSNLADDAATGALLGASLPAARFLGRGVGSLSWTMGGRLAGLTAGQATEGAVLGYAQDVSMRYNNNRENGLESKSALAQSFVNPIESKAAVAGFFLGGLSGLATSKYIDALQGVGTLKVGTPMSYNLEMSGLTSEVANPALLKDIR
jgi:hypothetical protein